MPKNCRALEAGERVDQQVALLRLGPDFREYKPRSALGRPEADVGWRTRDRAVDAVLEPALCLDARGIPCFLALTDPEGLLNPTETTRGV